MKTFFSENEYNELIQRLNTLTPDAQRQWGSMNAGQMLAHCSEAIRVPAGISSPKPMFIGKIIGGFVKTIALSEKPLRKNSPTDPTFVMKDEKNFHEERKTLLALMEHLYNNCSDSCAKYPHVFFGKMSTEEWGILMYKHLDHHLRQFAV